MMNSKGRKGRNQADLPVFIVTVQYSIGRTGCWPFMNEVMQVKGFELSPTELFMAVHGWMRTL